VSTGGAIVAIGGLGLAVFLYMRSQAQQAAALAAAQNAPGPGLATKLENTVKKIASISGQAAESAVKAPTAVLSTGWHAAQSGATSIVGGVAGTASSIVGGIRSIF